MKTCSIVPPSEVLAEYYGNQADEKEIGVCERIDPELETICMKALAKRPEDNRHSTCRELWEAIHGFVDSRDAVLRGTK